MTAFQTARDRARAEITSEIITVAGRHLAEFGAAALSIRAVARELGMTPSAMYRYFRGRDELLTVLISRAFNALGAEAEQADERARESGLGPVLRWSGVCRAVRAWALAHPHDFALIYGSPVPGYSAPRETVGPATRLPRTLAAILPAAVADGSRRPPGRPLPAPRLIHEAVLADFPVPPPPFEDLIERSLLVWTALIGTISFELFGHFDNTVTDPAAYFDAAMTLAAQTAGLVTDDRG